MTRRTLIAVTMILAIGAVAIFVVLNKGSSSGGSTTTSAGATSPSESDAKIDHQDPNQAGCSPTGVDVQASRVPVTAPDSSLHSVLFLRRSTACQAIWGEVEGLEGQSRYVVEVDVHRPSDNGQALFHDADMASFVFGNMLSARRGCVYATAFLQRGGKRGPIARTPCRT